ncbi:hypothetical protein [Clostridium perfringens]|uniref:hypothetical protein n=1 Tax=Clostridium perfringens TaxID=1502 RepID=UPI001A270ADE|nr:hypothetical protein [Clostridium perfringens]EGT4140852.1 hypothetical protein [Clostridium perfringens]EJT6665594.1 hypothetical protein [Clostridium perfringens]MCX0408560.1 hypothetical protein [Clostridium perfringens]MDM0578879.1 hypothetical protein [Clostridium perfringens]HAT4331387.1 hypothetical protein [Clostridium perfringens]
MNKYIYDNSELIRINEFDSITFKCYSNDTLFIEVLKLGNEKNSQGELLLNEVATNLKFSIDKYVNSGKSKKSAKELTKEIEEKFLKFIESDKKIFRIFDELEILINPFDPLEYMKNF